MKTALAKTPLDPIPGTDRMRARFPLPLASLSAVSGTALHTRSENRQLRCRLARAPVRSFTAAPTTLDKDDISEAFS